MTFDEMAAAVKEAERTMSAVNSQVAAMAAMCRGRLRKSSIAPWVLRQLKDELRKYNPHTQTWRD